MDEYIHMNTAYKTNLIQTFKRKAQAQRSVLQNISVRPRMPPSIKLLRWLFINARVLPPIRRIQHDPRNLLSATRCLLHLHQAWTINPNALTNKLATMVTSRVPAVDPAPLAFFSY